MSDAPLPIVRDTTGLSRGYRVLWRLKYLGLSIFGPAERTIETSPRERVKWERAVRVLRAHQAAGTTPDAETIQAAARLS
ncbi:hypothetical protein [Glutamicibacter sp. PS]|uniref:hypothetical protein n=1 Tax=Glutamicibacter TaxID=1742989 RepID=UPI002848C6D3|nr:hypothetical protein [Glutamicibacter sp. PS]MDR4534987.1 hypothetical protein [Glutamicibacter sp. PS]